MNKNKGFSLVEIIIVIAIMAILVAFLAPNIVQYVEKAKITSDQQLLQAINEALVYAASEPEIAEDPASKALIDNLTNGPVPLESLMTPANNKLAQSVMESLGWTDLNQTTYEAYIRSSHKPDCTIYVTAQGGIKNPLILWITTTDKTGKHDTSNNASTVADINNCISIQ